MILLHCQFWNSIVQKMHTVIQNNGKDESRRKDVFSMRCLSSYLSFIALTLGIDEIADLIWSAIDWWLVCYYSVTREVVWLEWIWHATLQHSSALFEWWPANCDDCAVWFIYLTCQCRRVTKQYIAICEQTVHAQIIVTSDMMERNHVLSTVEDSA